MRRTSDIGKLGDGGLRLGLLAGVLVLIGSCDARRSLDDGIRRTGLARFSSSQIYEPCQWPEPVEDRLLAAPRCGTRSGSEESEPPGTASRGRGDDVVPDADTLHERGLRRVIAAVEPGLLVSGIQDLKRVRALAPGDPSVENDLAAAFLKLAGQADDSYSLFFAADRLLAESARAPQHPELLYNRALAWDLMGVVDEAARAWTEVVETDPGQPWTADAEVRRGKLRRILDRREGAGEAPPVELSTGRRRVVYELLPDWARKLRQGDRPAAEDALAAAVEIARRAQDRLTLDALDVLTRAVSDPLGSPAELARAHELLGEGIGHALRFESRDALRALDSASDGLARSGSPLVLLAEYHAGMASYHVDRYDEARARLTQVSEAAAEHDDPLLRGLSLKGLALIELVTGHPEAAVGLFRQALAEVERSGDPRERIKLVSILADGLLAAGRDKEAWRLVHGSILSAWRHPDPELRYVVAAVVAFMADKRGFPHLGARMSGLSLDASHQISSPARLADAATWYARSLAKLGRLTEASEVLTVVQDALTEIADTATWRRATADHDCIEGRRLLAEGAATDARPRLRAAADYYEGASLLTHAAPCRAAEGSALLAVGDAAAARDVLTRSIALTLRLDGFLPRPEAYFGAVDPTLELLESVLGLHLDNGEPWLALELADLALRRAFPLGSPARAVDGNGALRQAAKRLADQDRVVLGVYPLPESGSTA